MITTGLESPAYGPRQPKVTQLQPFERYLRERLDVVPELTGRRLHRELAAMGYHGGYTAVTDLLRKIRPITPPTFEVRFETPTTRRSERSRPARARRGSRGSGSKTALGKALQYALGRWEALTRYADDGRLAIDNNVAERLMRGIAVTRKNFLFLGSDKGGDRAAILYTLIETAKLNGVTPRPIWPTPSISWRVGTWLPD